MMKLTLISQNVQGMNDPLAPVKFCNYYSDYFRTTELICVQEHKLRGQKLQDFGRQVWKDSQFLAYEALPAYNHSEMEPGVGSGGVGIFVAPYISHLVHASGVIGANMAQWITFRGYSGGDIGVVNVYAPHTPQERIYLWVELIQTLPSGPRWIFTGD
jgi:exonuclease III